MSKLDVRNEPEMKVAWVKAQGGPAGGKEAFRILESRMFELKGRKMYGIFFTDRGDYYAAVRLDGVQTDDMGFERGIVPAGTYARAKFKDWIGNEDKISGVFQALDVRCREAGFLPDGSRPDLEFYRSQKEMLIMTPVKG